MVAFIRVGMKKREERFTTFPSNEHPSSRYQSDVSGRIPSPPFKLSIFIFPSSEHRMFLLPDVSITGLLFSNLPSTIVTFPPFTPNPPFDEFDIVVSIKSTSLSIISTIEPSQIHLSSNSFLFIVVSIFPKIVHV